MKLTITTRVSVDGVVQGNGGRDASRSGGFERGGWAMRGIATQGFRPAGRPHHATATAG